jgi:hypothetical protein
MRLSDFMIIRNSLLSLMLSSHIHTLNNFHIKKQFSYIHSDYSPYSFLSSQSFILSSQHSSFCWICWFLQKPSTFVWSFSWSWCCCCCVLLKNVLIKAEIEKTEIKLILCFGILSFFFAWPFIASLFIFNAFLTGSVLDGLELIVFK